MMEVYVCLVAISKQKNIHIAEFILRDCDLISALCAREIWEKKQEETRIAANSNKKYPE